MNAIDPLPLAAETVAALESVTTATLTTVLLKKGLRNVWIRGTRPVGEAAAARRRAGRAFTLRFVPAREDLATPASWASPISTRAAIEAMPAGAIAVVDAMGITDAGIFGDILCARMTQAQGRRARQRRRRPRPRRACSAPACRCGARAPRRRPRWPGSPSSAGRSRSAAAASPSCPNDVIVADGDGAVVVPAALLDEVLESALEQERLEGWIMREVEAGVPLPGLYPSNEATKARYEAWRTTQPRKSIAG